MVRVRLNLTTHAAGKNRKTEKKYESIQVPH